MENKLTASQKAAISKLQANGGRLRGKDGWANGNTVRSLFRIGAARFDIPTLTTVLSADRMVK